MSLFGCISRANRAYTAFVIEHEYMYFLYNDQKNLYICRYIKSLDNMEVLNKKTAGKTLRPERIIQFGEGNFLRAFADYLKLAEQPDMRFVISNTTEAGIVFDSACRFDDAPAASYPGKLTQLLYHRFRKFGGDPSKGLIIFPCELIFLNGHRLKETIIRYIRHWNLGDEFRRWFETACGVYATLFDRIVPGFPHKDIDSIKNTLGYDDNLVVQAEVFHLWVIEAPKSVAAEFPADKAGLNVLFVDSEAPYHERKVTLLNGPHTVLSPVAYLSGINIVRDACRHEVIGRYIHRVMFDELMET